MTVEQIKSEKQDLNLKIQALVRDFQDKTNVKVRKVHLDVLLLGQKPRSKKKGEYVHTILYTI